MSLLRLQRAFANARKAIVAWMIVAAVGAVRFGWATRGIPDDDPPELTDAPVMGVLRPGDDVVKELNPQLSGSCRIPSGDAISVVVLSEGRWGTPSGLSQRRRRAAHQRGRPPPSAR